MGKVGGNRNYGYGKQLVWAGENALADRYGQGHFGTRATHEERWHQFVDFLAQQGMKDARDITQSVVMEYARLLKTLVNSEEMSVAYAQNRLSTVNVVLETMRKDSVMSIKPAQWVGQRSHVRTICPATIKPHALKTPTGLTGQNRTSLIAQLTRQLGLRFKEASMLDCGLALEQARSLGKVNITRGTKGGRGNGSDRWIPVDAKTLNLIKKAALVQDNEKNIIPLDMSYVQWRDHAYNQWRKATQETSINGFHDMRAAYACERYQGITGCPAPVMNGKRQASKSLDARARTILAQELGHNRIDVVAAYIGSSR